MFGHQQMGIDSTLEQMAIDEKTEALKGEKTEYNMDAPMVAQPD
jgi:hypothetical protein